MKNIAEELKKKPIILSVDEIKYIELLRKLGRNAARAMYEGFKRYVGKEPHNITHL